MWSESMCIQAQSINIVLNRLLFWPYLPFSSHKLQKVDYPSLKDLEITMHSNELLVSYCLIHSPISFCILKV